MSMQIINQDPIRYLLEQTVKKGFFSKKEQQIESTVQRILQSGINDLLLSADAFHQQHIPLEPVLSFAQKVREKGENCIRLSRALYALAQSQQPDLENVF